MATESQRRLGQKFSVFLWRFCVISGVILACSQVAQAWQIDRFQTHLALHPDSTATVTETIVADFTGESRHGLDRDIPIHYADRAGQNFVLRLRVQAVTDEQGRPRYYRLESPGRYLRIRIGDPNRTVTGLQTYQLVYDVQRGAVRFFADHDECYWNATGNEWAVPIQAASAVIEFPPAIDPARMPLQTAAFTGGYGSRASDVTTDVGADRVTYIARHSFNPYEGLTIVAGWPHGLLRQPSGWRVVIWWLQDNWVYGVPLLVLIGMLLLWNTKGRDPKLQPSLVVEYDPPQGLTPAEAGTLIDERADVRDVTSTIIDLAVRGYLRIEPITSAGLMGTHVSDYRLVELKPSRPSGSTVKPHERELLDGLFEGGASSRLVSDLKDVFYTHVQQMQDEVYQTLVDAKYFDSHPQRVRKRYLGTGIAVALLAGWLGFRAELLGAPTALALMLSGALIAIIGHWMPRRTLKGAQVTDQILGFVEFLRRADADRLRRINDPSLFERGLPYALAFGVATAWAKAFEGLAMTPPAWYGGTWGTYSPTDFSHQLNHTMASMNQTLTSTPRSSSSFGGSGFGGGGGSGGGGGGGGGGGW